jgi:hypothetical protein
MMIHEQLVLLLKLKITSSLVMSSVGVIYPGYPVPSVTAQNFRIRMVPSSGKLLGNHTPYTRKQPYLSRLRRWGHQLKKN